MSPTENTAQVHLSIVGAHFIAPALVFLVIAYISHYTSISRPFVIL